jgi:assimilatory nitrate reductase catalytic subunit
VPSVPEKPGKTAVEMFQAAADGEIKALWIACTNPAQSMPDQATVRRALERAELVIVQEAFATTSTCDYADLLLPATTWGEKTGTVTNSERRISRVRPAVVAPGETRHDWSIAVDFAQRLEKLLKAAALSLRGRQAPPLPPLPSFPIPVGRHPRRGNHLERTPRIHPRPRPGHHRPELRAARRRTAAVALQAGRHGGQGRLYEDGVFPTADGKARFANTVYKPVAEPRESRYPFSLTTGRLRDQWHGMSRTGTLGRLFGHVAEPAVQMNAQDMARRLLKDGDLVHVTSKRGSIVVPLQASPEVAVSQAFIAMHWGEEYLSGQSTGGTPLAGVNALTTSAYCPSSKQPELKHAAVKILKAEMPWTLLAMAWLPEGDVLAAREQLKPLMAQFPFTSCVPFSNNTPLAEHGRERNGVLFRAASHEAPPDDMLAALERILGLGAGRAALCRSQERPAPHHAAGAQRRRCPPRRLCAGRRHQRPGLDQDPAARRLAAQAYGRLLLLPGAKPPVAVQSRGKPVCTCFNVSDMAIDEHLALLAGRRRRRPSGHRRRAAGFAAGDAQMRHQLRLLRARAQTPGALVRGSPVLTAAPRTVIPIRQVA